MNDQNRVKISALGSYLPERILSNLEFEKMIDTTDNWIRERTGIAQRHMAAPAQATSDLSLEAAKRALKQGNIDPKSIDLVIVATVTPDHPFPAVACGVAAELGCNQVMAFDLSAACSGFLYAVSIARQMISTGAKNNVLIVGAETLSRITDYTDRSTAVLFGDGAGAVVLSRALEGESSEILADDMTSDGSLRSLLYLPAGGSRIPASEESLRLRQHFLRMNGREIFKSAVRAMDESSHRALEKAGLSCDDIDWLIPHQANQRIMSAVAERLSVPSEKVISIVERTGNTSSASIPLALDFAVKNKQVKKGDTVLCTTFGGGLTTGSIVFKY